MKQSIMLALLLVVALALLIVSGGDDQRDLERHIQWEQASHICG